MTVFYLFLTRVFTLCIRDMSHVWKERDNLINQTIEHYHRHFFFAFFLSCSIGNTILTDSRYAIGTTIDQRDYSSPILCSYTPNGVRVYTYINESGDSNNEQLII